MPSAPFNPVVVAPTYNNARTLGATIDGVVALGLPLIVVNDGSTDATADLLRDAVRRHELTVLAHPRNHGKAAALRTAFIAAREAGHTHAVTIDTDGQHDPGEIPRLLERARDAPTALVLGLRDKCAEGYPARSRFGRRMSNLFIRMESGLRVEDSQCGLRVYPLGLVGAVRCGAGRFGFETEIVTRAAWARCPVIEVPVACRYLPPGQRVSHLNPFLDTVRAFGMHARLLGRALLPWPRHPQWPPRPVEAAAERAITASPSPSPAPSPNPGSRKGLVRRFLRWMDPRDAWRQARRDRVGREMFSAGLAVGAFIGNLPVYGLHAWIGLYVSRRFHLHPLAVFAGTNISTPPIGPLLNVAAVALGHLLLHGSLPQPGHYSIRDHTLLEVLGRIGLEWTAGSLIVGLACAAGVFLLSNRLIRLAPAPEHPDAAPSVSRPTGGTAIEPDPRPPSAPGAPAAGPSR